MSLNFAIILRDMGYPSSFANYMSTPCYIFSAIVSFIVAWSSDKTGDRPWHLAIVQTWVSVWYLIMGVVNNGHNSPALLFVGTYAVSINVTMSVLILTYANEVFQEDRNSRAIAVAVINAIGNLAPNFINVAAWVVSDSPAFRKFIHRLQRNKTYHYCTDRQWQAHEHGHGLWIGLPLYPDLVPSPHQFYETWRSARRRYRCSARRFFSGQWRRFRKADRGAAPPCFTSIGLKREHSIT